MVGGAPGVHFQPGVSAGSSRSESKSDAEGAETSWSGGSKSKVSEKPGMFKLV